MSTRVVSAVLALFVLSVPIVGWSVEMGVALTASHLLGFCLLGIAAVTWWRQRPALPRDAAVVGVVAFVAVAALTVSRVWAQPDFGSMNETAHAKSLKQFIGLGFGVVMFAALYCVMRWYDLGLMAARTHYWTTATFAVLALVQYGIATVDLTSPLANFPVYNSTLGTVRPLSLMYGFPRVSLTLVEPSMLAIYLLTGWAFWLYAVGMPVFESSRQQRLFLWSGCVLGVAVIITGSRLAYGMVAVLVFGAIVFRPHRLWRLGLVLGSFVVAILLTGPQHALRLVTLVPAEAVIVAPSVPVPILPQVQPDVAPAPASVLERALTSVESAARVRDISVQQRAASYMVAARVVVERPLLGSGLGTSAFHMKESWPASFVPFTAEWTAAPSMMSHYATVVTETGLLGLACLAVFTAGIFIRLAGLWRRGGMERNLAWGVGASLAAYYLSALATAFIAYQILLVWLLVAVALTVRRREPGERAVVKQ